MGLYSLLLILTHIPACQTYIGQQAAQAIGQKLGTKVSIGRVDLGLFNRLILDDVLILDQQQKELLRAARLSVKLQLAPLAEGRIAISSAQIFGAHAQLYKPTAQSQANFQFVLDSLASKDTTSHTPLDLRVNSLIMRHSSVRYDQWDSAPQEGRLSPQHLNLKNISAHIILKALTNDSLNLNVKRLALTEQSGLDVKKLTFKLVAGQHGATLNDFSLQLPKTSIRSEAITATFDSNRLKETLQLKGGFENSRVTLADLSCLLPALRPFDTPLLLNTAFQANPVEAKVNQLSIGSPQDDLMLRGHGTVANWQKQPSWNVQVELLRVSAHLVSQLASQNASLPPLVSRIGDVSLRNVWLGGHGGSLTANGFVDTSIGSVELDLLLHRDKTFSGRVATTDFSLKDLLADEQFGNLTADVRLNGQTDQYVELRGTVPAFDYKGYTYTNIDLNGRYAKDDILGRVKIEDPNLAASLEGQLARPKFKLAGRISHLHPSALKLSERWGDAAFSADIDANFTATNMNDAQGALSLRNFTMRSSSDNYILNYLLVESGYTEGIHFVTLNSDFAHADLAGQFDYTTLARSITNLIGAKLPTLPGLPPQSHDNKNNFNLKMTMAKTDWLQRLLGVNFKLEQPLELSATINDHTQTIALDCQLPAFSYNGGPYRQGRLRITSPNDTMRIDVALTKLMANRQAVDLHLTADASNNNLTTRFSWDNNNREKEMSGTLNLVGHFYRNLENQPEAHVNVLPSEMKMGSSVWEVDPADILYSTNRLLIDHVAMHSSDQFIKVNGVASRHATDSLFVDLNKVEVAYILDLVNFHSVEFGGQATGRAFATSVFNNPDAHANLRVSHFTFENGRMGTLSAQAAWNKHDKQIDINATTNDGPDAMTYIKGYVSPQRNDIDLNISARGTYIDFLHEYTHSFMSDVTGHAHGDIRVVGPFSGIDLLGQLVVDGQATITALNTTYELRQDTVNFIPNDILLSHAPIYDKSGNIGYLTGGIHHQKLTNLSLGLHLDTDQLLAYDFDDFGDQTFYGTVYAAGAVDINMKGSEVVIDCNVTPLTNTVFTYNAATPDAISGQEFIVWTSDTPFSPGNAEHPLTDFDLGTNIHINFLINVTPDATMRLLMDERTGDYITLAGNGTIRATYYDKGSFQMFGTYTVDHGTYDITIQNIIKKNFQFQPGGTIVFGGNPYNAALSLQAVYTVSGVSLSDLNIGNSFSSNTVRVNCLMNISGQPNSPQVTFDLDMPTVNADEKQMVRSLLASQQEMNQQVLYLLGIGRFYNQGQNNAQNQQDQTSLAMQSFLSGTISTQINTMLSQIIKNDNWNFGANISTGTEGWNNAEYEGIINGRMFNNRLLINGQFGYRDKATQANPSFIGDFDIRYLLQPSGNLALKVYNQTNDRYFTRSSLNTQGIGLIMKKDFNNLHDLLPPKREKSAKKSKKNRRAPKS